MSTCTHAVVPKVCFFGRFHTIHKARRTYAVAVTGPRSSPQSAKGSPGGIHSAVIRYQCGTSRFALFEICSKSVTEPDVLLSERLLAESQQHAPFFLPQVITTASSSSSLSQASTLDYSSDLTQAQDDSEGEFKATQSHPMKDMS